MKPGIPRGTRDFGPAEMQKRQYILGIIRRNFELFGYQPIETPAMENITTLLGKYGDEGDKLIFKILNSAAAIEGSKEDFNKLITSYQLNISTGLPEEAYKENSSEEDKAAAGRVQLFKLFELDELIEKIKGRFADKALRYDLTVPFARFVVMNQHHLVFPFKRYQIQPVWRADKPQKGRYREFFQCDADVIGSDSLVNELELISLIDKTFGDLQLPVKIKFNNRKILTALAQVIGHPDKIIAITVAIDKLDKIGMDGVIGELCEAGLDNDAVLKLKPILEFSGGNEDKAEALRKIVGGNEEGMKGIEEIVYILNRAGLKHSLLELDITLARGLNYYTGTIFEVKANAGTFTPSILGGGRYDDLTGIFGLADMSGVGISFGIDRIYDVLEELKKFPASISSVSLTKVLFAHFDEESRSHCLRLADALRGKDIACDLLTLPFICLHPIVPPVFYSCQFVKFVALFM